VANSGESGTILPNASQQVDHSGLFENLSPESSTEAIREVLSKIASLHLEPLAKDRLITTLAQCTKHNKKLLIETLAQLQLNGDGTENDILLPLIRKTLGVKFANGEHLLRTEDGSFLHWDKTHFVPIADGNIQAALTQAAQDLYIPGKPATNLARQAFKMLRETYPITNLAETEPSKYSVVNCLNGELWIDAEANVEFKAHSPKSRLTYRLDVQFDPDAKSPKYDEALLGIFAMACTRF
jgi:hypothetical protein